MSTHYLSLAVIFVKSTCPGEEDVHDGGAKFVMKSSVKHKLVAQYNITLAGYQLGRSNRTTTRG